MCNIINNILYISAYLDINECDQHNNTCSNLKYSYCFNYNGNYECKCNTGYEKINDICKGYNKTQHKLLKLIHQHYIFLLEPVLKNISTLLILRYIYPYLNFR